MKTSGNNLFISRKVIYCLVLFFLMIILIVGQKTNAQGYYFRNTGYRHSIFFETLGATGLGGSVNYKHSLWLGRRTSLNASAGIGCILFSFNEKQDLVVPISVGMFYGKKNGFEWALGFSTIAFEKIYAPNIALGYRKQKGSTFVWIGAVALLFYEASSNYDDHEYYHQSRWTKMGFLPVPGFKIGKSF